MNKSSHAVAAFVVLFLVLTVLAMRVYFLTSAIENAEMKFKTTIATVQDSVSRLEREIDSLKEQVPGLGEYMSTIQLHVSKLWYAAHASNWDLALFELGELNEAMEGGKVLHAVRNKVDISGVLQSIQNTQLQSLKQSIAGKKLKSFEKAYEQTLEACNGCHRPAGYAFIQIITPTGPPVTNQRWIPPIKEDLK